VTVPVAAEGETVAVSVTLAPATGVEVDAARVVVVEGFDDFQKLPHPARRDAPTNIANMNAIPVPGRLHLIKSPCL
jgi:hypothetical protein